LYASPKFAILHVSSLLNWCATFQFSLVAVLMCVQKRQQYSQTYQGLEPQIKELDAEMKHTATFDHGRGDGRSADGASILLA